MKNTYSKIGAIAVFLFLSHIGNAQTIGTFNSVQPSAQTQNLRLPSSHTFQRIIRSGDALSSGGTLGNQLDFTGYVPIASSSTDGFLSINSETAPAECAILSIAFNNTSKLWNVNSGGKVDFPFSDIGSVAAFCSGTVTPKNTVMICEEATAGIDGNNDGYEDLGWIIEIDPATRKVINQDAIGGVDKLWAMGRQVHENVVIKSDQTVAYWGGDNAVNGFMYKFVPSVPGNFSDGLLYVLQTTSSLGTGTWQLLNNTAQADRNNTIALSNTAGAYNFNRIEDVEIGPDSKIYFATTTTGNILRFRDLGASVDQLEVFVEATTSYDVDGAGPFPPESMGSGADNLAFDGEGNLWVLQDGNRSHIWVVGPSHTSATPNVRLFATTPAGSEPTGITFSPDFKYLFLSIQHPNSSNTSAQTDAAGSSVVFNTHTTLVIARAEFLGVNNAALPLTFTAFEVKERNNKVDLTWSVESDEKEGILEIQRSEDGNNFTTIGSVAITDVNQKSYKYTDENVPEKSIFHYRIKFCDVQAFCKYSTTKTIRYTKESVALKVFPVPAYHKLNVNYNAEASSQAIISIYNSAGILVNRISRSVHKGLNTFEIKVHALAEGHYYLNIENGRSVLRVPFTKTMD